MGCLPLQLVLASCKPGWVDGGGRCFYMSTGTKNWWDAKQDCIRRGGRLFEPRSKFWDYGCEVSIRYVCEDLEGNADCGVPDTLLVENSFKAVDVDMCRDICTSIPAC